MKIALIGNQNCGKTSLFNKLTGQNQKIGNWPGVTIEKKEGVIMNTNHTIFDLPGIYSLSPYSSEEMVARNFLLNEKPDLIVNVIDSTSLERSLFLTTQLLELDAKVILILNMTDLLNKKGLELNENVLSQILKIPAIKVSAKTGFGINDLIKLIGKFESRTQLKSNKFYSKNVEKEINLIENCILTQNKRFIAIDALVCNERIGNEIIVNESVKKLEIIYQMEIAEIVANERYLFIENVKNKCLKEKETKISVTEKIDKIVLNKWLAFPIFAFVISLIYFLSISVAGKFVSSVLQNLINNFALFLKNKMTGWGASAWVSGLVVDGIVLGVGTILSFVPQLVVLFLCVSVLETTGYMARIAFMFDRIFRNLGLSGKSLISFIVGTGCSVPAIMTTRTIENKNEKDMTVMLTPFVPCSAKLPIIVLFSSYFFSSHKTLVAISLYFLSIFVIIFSALIFKRIFCKAQSNTFVFELPDYKRPSAKYVVKDVTDKTKHFAVRAGTIIFICSIFVWFLSSFDLNLRFCESVNDSILSKIGKLISWFFYPIVGECNWAVSISAIQGLVAKEQVVSSLSVISGVSNGEISGAVFDNAIFSGIGKAGAYAFVVFNLFSAPCISAISAMKTELNSVKKTVFAVFYQIAFAWVVSSLIFLMGTALGG